MRTIDFASLSLVVIAADDDDLAAHAALLADIDKASGGKTVWRALGAASQQVAMAQ